MRDITLFRASRSVGRGITGSAALKQFGRWAPLPSYSITSVRFGATYGGLPLVLGRARRIEARSTTHISITGAEMSGTLLIVVLIVIIGAVWLWKRGKPPAP
ncbi:MAG: hypothetical protein ACRENK_05180 [Gemmatimonadaceae bacterium]